MDTALLGAQIQIYGQRIGELQKALEESRRQNAFMAEAQRNFEIVFCSILCHDLFGIGSGRVGDDILELVASCDANCFASAMLPKANPLCIV